MVTSKKSKGLVLFKARSFLFTLKIKNMEIGYIAIIVGVLIFGYTMYNITKHWKK